MHRELLLLTNYYEILQFSCAGTVQLLLQMQTVHLVKNIAPHKLKCHILQNLTLTHCFDPQVRRRRQKSASAKPLR